MQFERRLVIRSPEQSQFVLPVAGLGSRFLAMLIDFGLLLLVIFALRILLVLFQVPLALVDFSFSVSVMGGVSVLLIFVLQWGYFIFFEQIWNGQTPGKRVMKVRVLQSNGGPVTFVQSSTRNILRVVDALPMIVPFLYPLGYLVGFLCAWLHPQGRRIGDLLAGTVVVRQMDTVLPQPIKTEAAHYYNSFREDRALRRRLQQRLNKSEKELLLDLALRVEQLELSARFALTQRLCTILQDRLRLEKPPFMSEEKFVLNIADALYAEEEQIAASLRFKGSSNTKDPLHGAA